MVALNTILLSGGTFNFVSQNFDPEIVTRLLAKGSILMGVPTYYSRLLNFDPFTSSNWDHVRLFISGSAPLLPSVWNKFKAVTGHEIVERYGMTEAQMITSNPIQGQKARKCGTVGLPLPGVSVRMGPNDVIQVKGPNVFKGYWNREKQTQESFTKDGYFTTGDIGSIDSDGYLRILSREKDLIITGGLNVYPVEIEEKIMEIQGVKECAVIGVPHSDFGEAVVAVIVPDSKGHTRLTRKIIVEELEGSTAKFKLPKAVKTVENLPRNAMGKVEKAVLRNKYQNLFST